MTLFENPIGLAQKVSDLGRAVVQWQSHLRSGDIDESGPFIGKPALTEREAFAEIRELGEPQPLKLAWMRWAFYLTEARVNARLLAAMAQAYRIEKHPIEKPESLTLSLRELLERVLRRKEERTIWADLLASHTSRLRRLALEHAGRRDEIARRAGFSNADEVTAPCLDSAEWAHRVLTATDSLCRELVPTEFNHWLDAGLATAADRGWPAQLTTRTVQGLLGCSEWLDGLDIPPRSMPSPIAASSFARALHQLGSAVVQASAPGREPFVVAHDPYGLYRHVVGALFAHLTTTEPWQCHQLGLSRDHAREQARTLLVSELIDVRVKALALLVTTRARSSAFGFVRDFEELSHRCLGFCLPLGFAAVLPRIRPNAGQRLVSKSLAVRWTRNLVAQFDIDWFRNPRAVVATRDQLSRVLPISPDPDDLCASLDDMVLEFETKL